MALRPSDGEGTLAQCDVPGSASGTGRNRVAVPLAEFLPQLGQSFSGPRGHFIACALAREWFVDVDSIREVPLRVLLPWLASRDDLKPLADPLATFVRGHPDMFAPLAPDERPQLPAPRPSTTVAELVGQLAEAWDIEGKTAIPYDRKLACLLFSLEGAAPLATDHMQDQWSSLKGVLPFRVMAELCESLAGHATSMAAGAVQSFFTQVIDAVRPKKEKLEQCFTEVPIKVFPAETSCPAVESSAEGAVSAPDVPPPYEDFLREFLHDLRTFDDGRTLYKLSANFERYAMFSDKSVFVLLMELMPDDAWFIGHLYARRLKPIPLVYPFCRSSSNATSQPPQLGHNLVLSSLSWALRGDAAPLVVSFGVGRIGKTSLLRAAWGLKRPNQASGGDPFHDTSADIYVDGVLEVRPRGFHLIDVHGDWQRCMGFLPLLVRQCSLVLVHVSTSDFAPRTGELVAQEEQLAALLANRPKHCKAVLVAHAARGDSAKHGASISGRNAAWLPDGDLWQRAFRLKDALADVSLVAMRNSPEPDTQELVDKCQLSEVCGGEEAAFWRWTARLATDAKSVSEDHRLSVVEPSPENRKIAASIHVAITAPFSSAHCLPYLNTPPGGPLPRGLSSAAELYLDIVRRRDLSSLTIMADQLDLILVPRCKSLLAEKKQLEQTYRKLQAIKEKELTAATEKARDDIRRKLQEVTAQLNDAKVEPTLFWRELLSYVSAHRHGEGRQPAVSAADMAQWGLTLAQRGFQMELINGESLSIHEEFLVPLKRLMASLYSTNIMMVNQRPNKMKAVMVRGPREAPAQKNRALVVTVLGPQSHGKSTLLNFLFGLQFMTSPIRCTSGFNTTFLDYSGGEHSECVFVGDTEGLMSAERNRREQELFDRTLTFFCLLMSDVLLVNVRGTADANIRSVLEVALYAVSKLGQQPKARIMFVLRDMGDNPSELSRNEAYDSINASIEQIEQHFSWAPGMLNFRPKDVWLMPAAFDTQNYPNPQFVRACSALRRKIVSVKPHKVRSPAQCIAELCTVWNLARTHQAVEVLNFTNLQRFFDWTALNKAATVLIKEENSHMRKEWADERDGMLTHLKSDLSPTRLQVAEARGMTTIQSLTAKYELEVLDRLKRDNSDLREEDLERMEKRIRTSFANEKRCLEQELSSALSKMQTLGLLRTALDQIRAHLVHIREERATKQNIDETAAQREFEVFWAKKWKEFDQSLAIRITSDREVIFTQWVKPLYESWNLGTAGSSSRLASISLEKAAIKISPALLERCSERLNRVGSGRVCALFKSLLSLIGSASDTKIFSEVSSYLTNFLKYDVAIRPIDESESTVLMLAGETSNLLEDLDTFLEKIPFRLQGNDLACIVHSHVAMVIASRLAARNKALLSDLKRDFAVKKATFGTLYVKYRCGTDGEVDRAHSLADLVCVQIKQQLIQTNINNVIATMAERSLQPEELIDHCYIISFRAHDWARVLEYIQDAGQFMGRVFKEDWHKKVDFILTQIKQDYTRISDELIDDARLVVEHFQNDEAAASGQGDNDKPFDLTEQACNRWQRFLDTCIKRRWVHVSDLFNINKDFSDDLKIMTPGIFDLANFVPAYLKYLEAELRKPLAVDQVHQGIEQEFHHRFSTARGCTVNCPYCSQKCCNQANHAPGTPHTCQQHFFQAFRGWKYLHTRKPVFVMCNDVATNDGPYQRHDNHVELKFEDHIRQVNPEWRIDIVNIDPAFQDTQLRAWKAVGHIICKTNGLVWAEPAPDCFPTYQTIDQAEYLPV